VNFQSLRLKLIWLYGAAIALSAFCIFLIRYQVVSYRSQKSFDETLLGDAKLFASRLRIHQGGFSWGVEGLSERDALKMQEMESFAVVTDLQGRILREDSHSKYIYSLITREDEWTGILRQHEGLATLAIAEGTEFRFASVLLPPAIYSEPAVLHVGRSMERLRGFLHDLRVSDVFLIPFVLAICVMVGSYLVGRTLKPFDEIAQAAEKITHETLNTRIATRHKEIEIQRLVEAFNNTAGRLDEFFQQVRKFNAEVAHELRTPLAILRGETEVALRSSENTEEISSLLSSNLEEIDRLTRIVDDLLLISEAETGKQVLVRQPVHIGALLREVVDRMRILAADRAIRIDLNEAPQLWIIADRLWIGRALYNLLENAVKYSRDGSLVEVSAERSASTIRLQIKDNGIGISPEDLPHIFDRFYRADKARRLGAEGLGLGLAFVKWIIEGHHGTIRVSSQADSGTIFEVSLPEASPSAVP